jgi:hypothetical protein
VENATQAITDQTAACLTGQHAAAHTDADTLLASEIKEYYNSATTRLHESADHKLGEFKHKLKMETELHKDNATKAADSAICAASHVHPHISTSSPCVTCSQSRKSNVSQSRDISIECPQSTTPKASPAVATPLSQALMEPLS